MWMLYFNLINSETNKIVKTVDYWYIDKEFMTVGPETEYSSY